MAKTPQVGPANEKGEKTGCTAVGCKKPDAQFGFCSEHFDHFKFGLITRQGKKVPDFDKKFDHFMAMQQRMNVKKAA